LGKLFEFINKIYLSRWYPSVYKNRPEKKKSHRALDDIKESIEELAYYRKHVFK